jgi:hypothetical protein
MILKFRSFFAIIEALSLKLYLVSCDLLADGDYASFKARLRTFEARQVLWATSGPCTARTPRPSSRRFCDSSWTNAIELW